MRGAWAGGGAHASAWGVDPVTAALAITSAATGLVSSGVGIAQQIKDGRQARELNAQNMALQARAQAYQLRQVQAAQAQAAANQARTLALVGKLVPVALVAAVGIALLVALRPSRRSRTSR